MEKCLGLDRLLDGIVAYLCMDLRGKDRIKFESKKNNTSEEFGWIYRYLIPNNILVQAYATLVVSVSTYAPPHVGATSQFGIT